MRLNRVMLAAGPVLAVLCGWGWSPAGADETPAEAEHPSAHEVSSLHEGHEYKNAIGVILAGTWESESESTFFTTGAEYGREITSRLSAFGVAEHLAEIDAWVFVGGVGIHPFGRGSVLAPLAVKTGPGFENKRRPGREHEGSESPEEDDSENLFLWRAGLSYMFHTGSRAFVMPAVDVDFVQEEEEWVEAVVFGACMGYRF